MFETSAVQIGFETAHLRFNPASDMIARPPLPNRPPKAPGRSEDVIAGHCCGTIFLPEAPVLADGYDSGAAALKDCGVATAGVEGSIASHGIDLLIRRDLIQEVWLERGCRPRGLR